MCVNIYVYIFMKPDIWFIHKAFGFTLNPQARTLVQRVHSV